MESRGFALAATVTFKEQKEKKKKKKKEKGKKLSEKRACQRTFIGAGALNTGCCICGCINCPGAEYCCCWE
jgi:hypothetical protein